MTSGKITEKIAGLLTEIQGIEEVIKEKLIEKHHVNKWRDYKDNMIDGEVENEMSNIESYKQQINLLQRLTDVEIDRADVQILEQGNLWLTKIFRIDGSCMGEEFKIELEIKDSMNEAHTVLSETTDMTIKHCSIRHQRFLEHTKILQEEKNIQGFFMLLHSFTKWKHMRDVTYQHFELSYPDIVSQSKQHHIQLRHLHKACTFQIDWTISILRDNRCYPEITLTVDMDKVSSSNDLLSRAPDMFQLMLKELGIEKSINSLVALCSE